MNKTAAEIQKMLNEASDVISTQVTKIAGLESKNKEIQTDLEAKQAELAKFQRKEECEKLANVMIEKGLINPSDFQAEVKKYMGSKEDIGMLTKAAEMVIPRNSSIDFVSGESNNMRKTADEILEERFNTMK